MLTFRDLVSVFRKLEIDRRSPIIAHASLKAFGPVHGGAEMVLGSLLSAFQTVIMPVFTYKTSIIPEKGPENNAMVYGKGGASNRQAEFFTPDLPADSLMGIIPEMLRRRAQAHRSPHPILSFTGINSAQILESQTLTEPLAPIRRLTDARGWVLLLGVDHTSNTSIHYGERLAGRTGFVRWALTPEGIRECPGFPGCSHGFQAIAPHLENITREMKAGEATITAVPLPDLVEAVCSLVQSDPRALLCSEPNCARCNATRAGNVS